MEVTLFTFGNASAASVPLHKIFLLEQSSAITNMKEAVAARDNFCQNISRCAQTHSLNPESILAACYRYLPFLVALTEQIHKTANKNMSSPLTFTWTSFLADKQYQFGLFEDELAAVYATFGIAHYQGAQLALADRYSPPEMKSLSKDKIAISLLKKSAGIFSFMTNILLPMSTLHSSVRPIETMLPATQALEHLCLANIQELIVASAIKQKKSSSAIARLCIGIQTELQNVQESLSNLQSHYHQLPIEFKAYPRIKIDFYGAMAYYHQGIDAAQSGKYGDGIAYLQLAKNNIDEIRFPSSEHVSMSEMKRQVAGLNNSINVKHTELKKDNDTIYFSLVPEPQSILAPKGILMAKLEPFEPITSFPEFFFDMTV